MPLTYKEMQDLLMRELRLYHFPIAINFHKTQADVEEFKKKARYVEPVKPITYCQWEITARMQGQTVLAVLHDNQRVAEYFPETLLLEPQRAHWGNTDEVLPAFGSARLA